MGVLATATDSKLWNVVLTVVLYLHDYGVNKTETRYSCSDWVKSCDHYLVTTMNHSCPVICISLYSAEQTNQSGWESAMKIIQYIAISVWYLGWVWKLISSWAHSDCEM